MKTPWLVDTYTPNCNKKLWLVGVLRSVRRTKTNILAKAKAVVFI
ncbi:hypothetical protein MtrunA17_Chr7g0270981 [Medicago truncatula]|uniref:Uncharacterized protein n=1 Tax=Medicago truncatula TaxID=3880 RepID=A0A396H783_MEDTR|nr:hypothetical protein MtrunA17_Chr7g0270981 [Medicago truncatula]